MMIAVLLSARDVIFYTWTLLLVNHQPSSKYKKHSYNNHLPWSKMVGKDKTVANAIYVPVGELFFCSENERRTCTQAGWRRGRGGETPCGNSVKRLQYAHERQHSGFDTDLLFKERKELCEWNERHSSMAKWFHITTTTSADPMPTY